MAKSKAKSVGTWVILGLLFVGVIGFGTTNLSGSASNIGTVGDQEIGVQDYARALQNRMRSYEQQTGQAMSIQQAREMGLDQAVLGQLVAQNTLENEADRLGLSAGDERVAERVRGIQAFQGLDGEFDRDTYSQALERAGIAEADFEQDLRNELASGLIQNAVVGGIPAPEAYADALSRFLGQQRSFAWVNLGPEALAAEIDTPSQDELETYYSEHEEAFTAPETKAITYAWLTPQMLESSVEVSEEALRELYEQRIDEFVRPERRLVERLVFSDEAAAEDALARIEAGETDFGTLVEDRGLDLSDVDLGDVSQEELGGAGEGVFSASQGDVVGPLPSSLGPALYRVNAVLQAQEIPFEEARSDLRPQLAANAAQDAVADRRSEINDLVAGGATLEDLAERTEMQLGTLDWTGEQQEGIASYAAFREAAQAAEEGAFPELKETEDGGLFALRVDGVQEPTLRPFDEVRDQVAEAWRSQRRQELIMQQAEQMAERVQEAGGFTDDMPEPQVAENRTRRDVVKGAPQGFVEEVFAMEAGTAMTVDSPEGAIVVFLREVTEADPESDSVAAQREAVAQRATQGIAQDVYDVFAQALQRQTEVQIDQGAVRSVQNQFQ